MLLNYHPSPTFIYVICLQWSDIVADSISLTTYKVVLLSIGNKLRNGYNTTLKPHPATPTSSLKVAEPPLKVVPTVVYPKVLPTAWADLGFCKRRGL